MDSNKKVKIMVLESPNKEEYSSFQLCVNEIRRISCNKVKSEEEKKPLCEECIYKYFIEETLTDVYEGFLRLVVEFFSYTDTSHRSIGMFLALRVVKSFHKFVNTIQDKKTLTNLLNKRPFDTTVYVSNFLIFIVF